MRNGGNTNVSAHTLEKNNGGEKPKAHRTLPAGDGIGGGRRGWKPDFLERTWVILTVKRRKCVDITGEATSCRAPGRTHAACGVFLPKTRANLTTYRAPTPSPQEVWGRQEDVGPTRSQIWNVEYFKAWTAWFLPEKNPKRKRGGYQKTGHSMRRWINGERNGEMAGEPMAGEPMAGRRFTGTTPCGCLRGGLGWFPWFSLCFPVLFAHYFLPRFYLEKFKPQSWKNSMMSSHESFIHIQQPLVCAHPPSFSLHTYSSEPFERKVQIPLMFYP